MWGKVVDGIIKGIQKSSEISFKHNEFNYLLKNNSRCLSIMNHKYKYSVYKNGGGTLFECDTNTELKSKLLYIMSLDVKKYQYSGPIFIENTGNNITLSETIGAVMFCIVLFIIVVIIITWPTLLLIELIKFVN